MLAVIKFHSGRAFTLPRANPFVLASTCLTEMSFFEHEVPAPIGDVKSGPNFVGFEKMRCEIVINGLMGYRYSILEITNSSKKFKLSEKTHRSRNCWDVCDKKTHPSNLDRRSR